MPCSCRSIRVLLRFRKSLREDLPFNVERPLFPGHHERTPMNRSIPSDIASRTFDLIVIGAGINGVAIARDAAMRGMHVLVLDKGDISSGTTSWSTRLIHGGLRYLEHAEIGLVRESLRERERLLQNAAHLVKPIALILPIYDDARRGPALIRTGMLMYDLLSFDKSVDRHHMLSKSVTIEKVPSIKTDGLRASAIYFDAQATMAERLAVENAISAAEHGATVITYAQVDRIITEGSVVRGVEFTDLRTGATSSAQSNWVVNVAGPWVDDVLTGAPTGSVSKRFIGGTKGSHLVVAPFSGAPKDALYYEAKTDGRAVFVVPWNGLFLIGSTDIRYEGDLDDVRTDDAEIEYLLHETNALLPGSHLTEDDVLYSYCGVRPLPHQPAGKEGAITRKHIIYNHAPKLRGLLSIIGGKLTTHRSLAEEVVDDLLDHMGKRAPCLTAKMALPGAAGIAVEAYRQHLIATSTLPARTVSRLVDLYGSRAERVLALASQDPRLAAEFDAETGAIAAEVFYAMHFEMAETIADVLLRRTMVGMAGHVGIAADLAVAEIGRTHLGWDSMRAESEVASYRTYIERFRPRAFTQAAASSVA